MSSGLLQHVEDAQEAWECGYAALVMLANNYLSSKKGRLVVEEPKKKISRIPHVQVRQSYERLQAALVPLGNLPKDVGLNRNHPWCYGPNELSYPGDSPSSEVEQIEQVISTMNVKNFRANFVDPMKAHAADWRKNLTRLRKKIQAGSKADSEKKAPAVVPENLDVARLAKKIKRELKTGATKIDIARDFTNGNEKKANNLLRQLRGGRFSHLLDSLN